MSNARPRRWLVRLGGWLVTMTLLLSSCAVFDNEGSADDARAMVVRYLEALGGAEQDRGWSLISEAMRDGHPDRAFYDRPASSAVGPPPIDDFELTYEDDGLYAFTVTYRGELQQAYSQVLFTGFARGSPIACPNGPNQFEIAVIVGTGEFAGITANSCADGGLRDPREP